MLLGNTRPTTMLLGNTRPTTMLLGNTRPTTMLLGITRPTFMYTHTQTDTHTHRHTHTHTHTHMCVYTRRTFIFCRSTTRSCSSSSFFSARSNNERSSSVGEVDAEQCTEEGPAPSNPRQCSGCGTQTLEVSMNMHSVTSSYTVLHHHTQCHIIIHSVTSSFIVSHHQTNACAPPTVQP